MDHATLDRGPGEHRKRVCAAGRSRLGYGSPAVFAQNFKESTTTDCGGCVRDCQDTSQPAVRVLPHFKEQGKLAE